MKKELSSHQHGHHDADWVCAQLDAPKWPRVFSIASRVNLRWLACLPLQISSAHIQLYWRSWTEVTYSCNLPWIHRHGSSKDWASSCCQCTEITAKNNAIQLVPCVFSDALHLCLHQGLEEYFWYPWFGQNVGRNVGKCKNFNRKRDLTAGRGINQNLVTWCGIFCLSVGNTDRHVWLVNRQ